jgi:hypothetical protein
MMIYSGIAQLQALMPRKNRDVLSCVLKKLSEIISAKAKQEG